MEKREFTWRLLDKSAPHWSDRLTIAGDIRARHALRCFFPTEASLRAAWPLHAGEIPNVGKKTIKAIGDALGCPEPPAPIPNPKLAEFSDADLYRELGARQRERAQQSGYSGYLAPLVPRIREMHAAGKSPREIAEELELPDSIRYLTFPRRTLHPAQVRYVLSRIGLSTTPRPRKMG